MYNDRQRQKLHHQTNLENMIERSVGTILHHDAQSRRVEIDAKKLNHVRMFQITLQTRLAREAVQVSLRQHLQNQFLPIEKQNESYSKQK
jgi:hypothetical protein